MATAIAGTTPHVTKTLKIGAGAYKFVPLTTNTGDGGGKKAGVSWLRLESDGTMTGYVQPWRGDVGSPPTAWDATPAPTNAGDIGEACFVKAGGIREFGIRPDAEEGSDQTNMITALLVWGTVAGNLDIQGI